MKEKLAVFIKKIILVLILFSGISCQTGNNATRESIRTGSYYSPELQRVFEAHGGYDTWTEMKGLSFDLDDGQHQVISLQDRKVLIRSGARIIGFDGTEVWVMPDTASTENARFYHNLYFYFYAMPFVLGDPGTIYEKARSRYFSGRKFDGIKVTFEDDVGDSPKDSYLLYYDPESYQMQWLMYTVTYGTRRTNNQYSLIKYNDWKEINGLLLPTRLQWYEFEKDSVGKELSERQLENIQLSTEPPADALFEMPEGAKIAPMPVK